MIEDSYLALSLTESLASRAIESIRLGGKREIRNSLDLFRSFFLKLDIGYVPFYRCKYLNTFKGSPDYFIKRLVDTTNKEILKSFIVNMIYGVFLRKDEIKNNLDGRWIIDLTNSTDILSDVKKYNNLGSYVFFINCEELLNNELFLAIKAYKKCTFFLYFDKATKNIANFDYKSENICYFLSNMAYNNIGSIFKRDKLLYGIMKRNDNSFNLDEEVADLKLFDINQAPMVIYYNKNYKIDNLAYNEVFKIRKSIDISMAFINLNGLYKRIVHNLGE